MTQPESLRLAAELEACPTINYKAHAAELRRLHIDNEACGIHLSERMIDLAKVEAQRDALLEALKLIVEFIDAPTEGKRPDVFVMRISKARAAIAKCKENT